jgi:methylenetetrahydrofolate--tRNA-(uracil-5-)-methyltransferase
MLLGCSKRNFAVRLSADAHCGFVRVPAGSALAVDREQFAKRTTEAIVSHPNITLVREEVSSIPSTENGNIVIIASGPLTSGPLSESIREFCGAEHLYFYDAISPIVDADTIDRAKVFLRQPIWKGEDDYINCPMNRERYTAFYEALIAAEAVELHEFEKAQLLRGLPPIEEARASWA